MKIAAITITYNDGYKFNEWVSYYSEYKEDIYLHIIVDNGSNPEYLNRLESVFHNSVIIKRKDNGGCTSAYNDGIRYALQYPEIDSIMLIGNDIKLNKNGVILLYNFLFSQEKYGMVAPIMLSKDSMMVENYGCYFDFFYNMQSLDKGRPIEEIEEDNRIVGLVPGGMNLAKRVFYEKVGLQDENLFMYSDEPDMCFRARKKGFLFAVTKKALSWHQHINPDKTAFRQPLAPYFIARNYIYISKKHHSFLRYFFNLSYFSLRVCTVKLKSFFSSKQQQQYATYLFKGLISGFKGNMDNRKIIEKIYLKKINTSMKKILLVFGTRPEAIKMAPLVKRFACHSNRFDVRVCVTAQHRQMLDQVLDFFEIKPYYDLNLMKPNQTLNELWADILVGMKPILDDFKPDFVFVHGDTATSTAVALSAYFAGCKVGHIEAGLRTWNKWSPFPEEMNRQLTARMADVHFAPTIQSRDNLLKEGIPGKSIIVTGNTVIDALHDSVAKVNSPHYTHPEVEQMNRILDPLKKLILVTGHRRENFGEGFEHVCKALKEIATNRQDVQIVYPVHLNPNVQNIVRRTLTDVKNIFLISPLSYPAFVWLMNKTYLIITDSGGVQEEAPSLGKPVLVMRNTTERPEAVRTGTVLLVGTDCEKIVSETCDLLSNAERYYRMSKLHNPYGDGLASMRIVDYIDKLIEE